MKGRGLWLLAGVCLVGTSAGVLALTRAPAPPRVEGTRIEHRPGELPAVEDQSHYAPGSPPAVAEAFLRSWWRGHYEDAKVLAAGAMRARCERDYQKTMALTPEEREAMRQVQLVAEAAQFDLERARVTEEGDGAPPRRRVVGEIHAHGRSPDGRRVESRREQVLLLELVEGAWRVVEWTPSRADAGIVVH